MTDSTSTPKPVTDRNTKAKMELVQRGQEKRQEATAIQMAQYDAQRKEMQLQRNLRIREVQALEAIAEALHVAYEPQILAWRTVQEKKAEDERIALEAIQADLKAKSEEDSHAVSEPLDG